MHVYRLKFLYCNNKRKNSMAKNKTIKVKIWLSEILF